MSRKVKTYLLSLPLQSTEQQLVYQFSSVIYLVIYTARTKIIGWLFERLASHFNCRRDKMHTQAKAAVVLMLFAVCMLLLLFNTFTSGGGMIALQPNSF